MTKSDIIQNIIFRSSKSCSRDIDKSVNLLLANFAHPPKL